MFKYLFFFGSLAFCESASSETLALIYNMSERGWFLFFVLLSVFSFWISHFLRWKKIGNGELVGLFLALSMLSAVIAIFASYSSPQHTVAILIGLVMLLAYLSAALEGLEGFWQLVPAVIYTGSIFFALNVQ